MTPVKHRVLFCLHRHDRELDPQLQCRIKWGSSRFVVTVNTGYRVNPERWDAELDVPDPTISLGMGHRIAGHRTTAIYIKRDQRKVDEANRKVIDYIKGTVPHLTT